MKYKILFVSHNASKTGAPIVLLHFIKWLKNNKDYEITILLKSGGELLQDFRLLADTYIWYEASANNWLQKFIDRVYGRLKKMNQRQYEIIKKLQAASFNLAYTNTIDSNELIPVLKPYINVPFLVHVHENEYSTKVFFPASMSKNRLQLINHYIAVSLSTKENLLNNYAVKVDCITQISPFIQVKELKKPKLSISTVKAELGITDEFIVGGCGFTGWRKGVDYFLSLALLIKTIAPEKKIKFIWVGFVNEQTQNEFEYEKNRLGITSSIIFTGQKANPVDYFQIFDVFALTSREDPFPLVCLEAAALSIPILCFKNAGGMPEFVKKGAGWVIPYGNTLLMANKIIELSSNKIEVENKGKVAKDLVAGYDVNIIAPKIIDCITQTINKYA